MNIYAALLLWQLSSPIYDVQMQNMSRRMINAAASTSDDAREQLKKEQSDLCALIFVKAVAAFIVRTCARARARV